MDGAQVGVLKQANQVSLASFLLGQIRERKVVRLKTISHKNKFCIIIFTT